MFKKSAFAAQRPAKLALLASIALAAAVSAPIHAATTTATASATVIQPIAITKTADLSFGKFFATSAGTVTVNTSGVAGVTGGATTAGGTPGAAAFDITGEPNATYAIDTSSTTATVTSGANSMALALITAAATGVSTGTISTGALDGTGKQTLYVGGVLTVGATQAPGQYAGTVSVAVNYN